MQTLLTVHQVDPWRQFNPHIVHGYRPRMSARAALRSFFEWHNESVNIWSHALAACFVLYLAVFPPTLGPPADSTPGPRHERRWSNNGGGDESFLLGASFTAMFRGTCLMFFPAFILSVVYHLFMPCATSARSYHRLRNCDLVSALTCITGTAWSFLYRGNACSPSWGRHGGAVALLLSYLLALYGVLFAVPHGSIGRAKIVGFYCVCRFFIFLWIEQPKVLSQGYHQALHYHMMSHLLLVLGGAVHGMRFPEKQLSDALRSSSEQMTFRSRCCRWVRRYVVSGDDVDFMWNSHNLWHYCVILSVTMMILGCFYDLEEFELARC